jgi:transcriptional regulator with GAF, ATPase, and Fis domain
MPRTTVYIVSDDFETTEKVKGSLTSADANVQSYSSAQWREGLESPYFRGQLVNGIPALVSGSSPVEARGNVLPFPTVNNNASHDSRVSTMNELESKAIENAIMQFRGNLTEAAKALGIGRATLYRKVKQYQIDPSVARKKRAA